MPADHNSLPLDVLAELRKGHKIEAIRLLREATGLGLKESKDRIDLHLRESPLDGRVGTPGEVPRSNGFVGWVVALAIVGLIALYVIRTSGW